MPESAVQQSSCPTPEQAAAHLAEQIAEHDALLDAMAESVFYADFLPMQEAPRDGTGIEMRYRSWADPLLQPAEIGAVADPSGFWLLADGTVVPFGDETHWQWRPIGGGG